MDNGPFRVPRPASRPTPARQQPSPSSAEVQEPVVKQEVKSVHRSNAQSRFSTDEKSQKKFILPLVGVIVTVALVVIGWSVWSHMQSPGTAIDSGKYQAVFFTNGHVYFGKLSPMNSDSMKLTEVFYLQSQSTEVTETDSTGQPSNNQSIIKLGDEVHGPEDAMIINKEHILFYENLKPDGKVAQAIEEYKSK